MNTFRLDIARKDLDLRRCLTSGQVFRWTEVGDQRWVGIDGPNAYAIQQHDDGLDVQTNATLGDLRAFLRLDEPVDLAAHLSAMEPRLEPVFERLRGFRLLRPSDPVETTFCFLCTANNNLARITGMVRHLAAFGTSKHTVGGKALTQFPSLTTIAQLEEGELRAMGFGYRGRTIPRAAQQMLALGGEPWLQELATRPWEEAHDALKGIHGIGPKLADCIALYALHHTRSVPIDTHLWQAAAEHLFPEWRGASLTDRRYRAIGDALRERFGTWAGHAHLFLYFDHLERGKAKPK